jgi:hypothetical protein
MNTRVGITTDSDTPIRMYIALHILRAWNDGTAGFDGLVVKTINDWIDQGMRKPILWPDSPFFKQWAAENGIQNAGGFIADYLMITMNAPAEHAKGDL